MQVFEKEKKVYESQKNSLMQEGKGKYVVIQGDVVLRFFSDQESALKAGYAEFGPVKPFFVHKVAAKESIHYFSPQPNYYGIHKGKA